MRRGVARSAGEVEAPAERRDETGAAETRTVHSRGGAEAGASPADLADRRLDPTESAAYARSTACASSMVARIGTPCGHAERHGAGQVTHVLAFFSSDA